MVLEVVMVVAEGVSPLYFSRRRTSVVQKRLFLLSQIHVIAQKLFAGYQRSIWHDLFYRQGYGITIEPEAHRISLI